MKIILKRGKVPKKKEKRGDLRSLVKENIRNYWSNLKNSSPMETIIEWSLFFCVVNKVMFCGIETQVHWLQINIICSRDKCGPGQNAGFVQGEYLIRRKREWNKCEILIFIFGVGTSAMTQEGWGISIYCPSSVSPPGSVELNVRSHWLCLL